MEIDEQFESEEDACAYAERANKDGRARFVFEQTHGYVP